MKGEGVPLPIPEEGSPPGRRPAPCPGAARGGAREEVGSGDETGMVRRWVGAEPWPQSPSFRPEGGASFPQPPPPPPPPPLGYLSPCRRFCGPVASDTCLAEKPPPPAIPGVQLQPPPPPGLGHAPSSKPSCWPPATACSSCSGSLGRAPPSPHRAAAAAAAAVRAVTVSGSPDPAGSAPPTPQPHPPGQAAPPASRLAFLRTQAPPPRPPSPPVPGRVWPPATRCPSGGETLWGWLWAPPF